MRFVTIKSAEQQSVLAVHRTRDLLVGQRTQLINLLRSKLAEYGFVLAKGMHHALRLVRGGCAGDPPAGLQDRDRSGAAGP